MKMEKRKLILGSILIVFFCIVIGYKAYLEKEELKTRDLQLVLSLEDKVEENSVWCGTFNLIWNDLKNDLAKQEIVFSPQLEIVENLNKGTFTTKELSDKSYYKVLDKLSLELKEKIEKEIKEKFQETSDILNDFDWENVGDEDYFLYAMLKKEFEFPYAFTELQRDNFGYTKNVEYFGIDATTASDVRSQVTVLYYNDNENFAICLETKNEDEVYITRGHNEATFLEIYHRMQEESNLYKDSRTFAEEDTLKIPNLKFKTKKEFTELENKDFSFYNGKRYYIKKALQTVEFELDKKGGKVKSEAGMSATQFSAIENNNPRDFLVNGPFVLFLKEKDKNLPYLAMQVEDIEKFI